MGLLIQDEAVVEKVARLATETGQSADQAIGYAVDQLLAAKGPSRKRVRLHGVALQKRIEGLQAEIAALPVTNPSFTEDDLYDKNGLPA